MVARIDENPLDMPQFPRSEIGKIIKTFNMYVKFPKTRWADIKKAEENTTAGNKIYQELKDEFTSLFFNKKDADFEAAAMGHQVKSPMG